MILHKITRGQLLLFLLQLTGLKCLCPSKLKTVQNDFDVLGRLYRIKDAVNNHLEVTHTHERGEKYLYTLNFCGNYKMAALKQRNTTNPKSGITIGKLDEKSIVVGGENWMFVQYFNGDKYGHHCHGQNRKAWIYIRCSDPGEKPELRVIEESRYRTKKTAQLHCFYLFEYNHPLACNIKPSKLSGGAIFLIILVSLVGAYFLFGFLYMRFILHAKGFNQIPNYPFWREFGNKAADGCDFFCRREETSNTYKGMADALDINSSDDDDKDDGLLPM